jgi:hypothetical protein
LGWYTVLQGSNDWNGLIDAANSSTVVSFSDWRVSNRAELDSVLINNSSQSFNYAPFNNSTSNIVFTSTTFPNATTNAFFENAGIMGGGAKTNSNRYAYFCRNHF